MHRRPSILRWWASRFILMIIEGHLRTRVVEVVSVGLLMLVETASPVVSEPMIPVFSVIIVHA